VATIIVPAGFGTTVSGVTLNDTLQAAPGVDLKAVPVYYEVDGNSILQSLTIGYNIGFDIGYSAPGSLTGTGNITGPTDASVGNLPLLSNYDTLDINGTIGVSVSNQGQITVSAGERLDLTAEIFSLGTITIAATGELDLDTPKPATLNVLNNSGKLKSTAPNANIQTAVNTGTIDITAGTLAFSSVTGAGTIIVETGARLDIASATAVSNTVVLNAGSTLRLTPTTVFTGTLQSPDATAKIDLVNLTATGASVSNGQILITTASGTVSLNETGLAQGLVLPVTTDGNGGTFIALAAAAAAAATPTPTPTPTADPAVYRFFDKIHGTQFLTASSTEATGLQASRADLTYEGTGFYAVNPATDANAAPVYRFFDNVYGTHFYTTSDTEKATVQSSRADLVYEGIGYYEHTAQQTGDSAVYRFFDSNFGTHFYTSSATERATIIATRPDLVSEGIGYYAPTT